MLRTLSRVVLVLALAAVLAACGSAASDRPAPTPIIIVVTATNAPTPIILVVTATSAPATPVALVPATATPVPPAPTAAPPTNAPPTAAPPTNAPPTAAPTRPAPTRTPAATPTLPTIQTKFPPDGVKIETLDIRLIDPNYSPTSMTALTFQVRARIKGQPRDGDGIDSVTFAISDNQGDEVYRHVERNAPYCAFQEVSGTTCRTLPARRGLKWRASDNDEIVNRDMSNGPHTLRVTVNGKNGELWNGEYAFGIR